MGLHQDCTWCPILTLVSNISPTTLHWRHNGRHVVSNHQQLDGLFNDLLWSTSKRHQSSGLLPLCGGEFTDDRWIPRTKDQQRGKSFHLMTSSWKNCDHFTKRYDALSSYVWLESNESSYYIVIIKCNRGVATTQLQTLVKVSIDQAILYLVLAFFRSSEVRITVMSNEHHGISDHWQLDHLFNSLFQLTKTYQIFALLDHYVWRGPTVICDSPYKGPVMRKPSPCRDVIIL